MKKIVSDRKISVVLCVVSVFFFVSCSSVNLEGNEDNLFSAPIDKSQNRQKANGVGSDGVEESVEISSQKLLPKVVSEISLEHPDYCDLKPLSSYSVLVRTPPTFEDTPWSLRMYFV